MTYRDLSVLIPFHGLDDFPTELGEKPAASLLNAFSILWHPHLLRDAQVPPRWRRADDLSFATAESLIIVPTHCDDLIPPDALEVARGQGAVIIRGESDRDSMLAAALAPLGEAEQVEPQLVADFFALGSVLLQTELLTRQMRSYTLLDEYQLHRHAVSAALAAINDDAEATRKHLMPCFEMLQESRERFYPVECYLIDLCLVTANMAGDGLETLLNSKQPFNLLSTANTWQEIVSQNNAWSARVQAAVGRNIAELLGGDDEELPGALMALDSTIWHLRRGRQIDRDLFGVAPTTWGRKQFGVGLHLPQILIRFGYRGALHFVLDDGLYPDDEQTQLRWEGHGGVAINAFSRIPIAADSASGFLRFPQRMGESMDYDHTAAVVFARWPEMRTPFLEDMRRAHAYAPVLGKFVTFSDFFSQTMTPGRNSGFSADAYLSPELVYAVARREANPISRWTDYWRRRRQFERVDWMQAMTHLLGYRPEVIASSTIDAESLEAKIEAAHPKAEAAQCVEADQAINHVSLQASQGFIDRLTAKGESGAGVLIVNTLSFPRRCLIEWPAGTCPPLSSPLVHGRQVEADRAWGLVELPPCGFVWLPTLPIGEATAPGKIPLAEGLVLRNDLFEVQISDVTGGIGQVKTYRRSPNRISQQIALRFPHEKEFSIGEGEGRETFRTWYTSMVRRESRIIRQGPLIGEIETLGDLLDDQTGDVKAAWRQRTRVVRGRAVVEVSIELAPAKAITGDPWTNYYGCRFAWKHEGVSLTASMQQTAQLVNTSRIEAPQFIEIADDAFRTTILTPGLPFHRKTGERMLDTLLLAEGETARSFEFAVAIDSSYPMQSSLDQYAPPMVMATDRQPAQGTQQGWFFRLSASNVQITRLFPSDDGKQVVVRLLETEGRGRVVSLDSFQAPREARQVDFNGESISTLKVDNGVVSIEVAPYEICDLQLTFS